MDQSFVRASTCTHLDPRNQAFPPSTVVYCRPEIGACTLGRCMKARTKDFSQGVYDGLKSCPPHPKVDRACQTDATSIPDHQMVISDSTLKLGLASRGLVSISLAALRAEILQNIVLHLRLDPTHSMEVLFTMNRVPRGAILEMWGKKVPSASDSDVLEFTWDTIERAMNCADLEPHHPWGSKAAKLHKVGPITGSQTCESGESVLTRPRARRYPRRLWAGPYCCSVPPSSSGTRRRQPSFGSARRSTTSPTWE